MSSQLYSKLLCFWKAFLLILTSVTYFCNILEPHWYVLCCCIFPVAALRFHTCDLNPIDYHTFPFDMSPLCNVHAYCFAFECGGHVNLALQPASMLQQAIGILQQATGTLQQAIKVCNKWPKLHMTGASQAYLEKSAQSSWRSTWRSLYWLKPTRNHAHWAGPAKFKATYILGPASLICVA